MLPSATLIIDRLQIDRLCIPIADRDDWDSDNRSIANRSFRHPDRRSGRL